MLMMKQPDKTLLLQTENARLKLLVKTLKAAILKIQKENIKLEIENLKMQNRMKVVEKEFNIIAEQPPSILEQLNLVGECKKCMEEKLGKLEDGK
jgi:hypothetical protein